MRPRISIRGFVRPSVRWSVGPWVRNYVENVTQKIPFLYTAGAKYVSFDNQTLNPEAFVPSLTKSIAISHFFA